MLCKQNQQSCLSFAEHTLNHLKPFTIWAVRQFAGLPNLSFSVTSCVLTNVVWFILVGVAVVGMTLILGLLHFIIVSGWLETSPNTWQARVTVNWPQRTYKSELLHSLSSPLFDCQVTLVCCYLLATVPTSDVITHHIAPVCSLQPSW